MQKQEPSRFDRLARAAAAAVMAGIFATACGGGSSGGSGPAGALTLQWSTPLNGATGVSRDAAIQLSFSASLNPATATAANVVLATANGAVSTLSLTAANNQLGATPVRRLFPLASYTVRVATGLTGANGETLASAVSTSFTTADGAWGTPQLIENNNTGFALEPRIALDGSGNALALWQQFDGARINIWSNRYTAGSGWGTPELVENDNAGNATEPRIVMNAAGTGFAIWHQSDGTRFNIWSNRYVPGTGWGTPQLLETTGGDAEAAQIAIDANGNAIAVWQQNDAGKNIWSNRYTAGTGWGTAQLIETDNAGDAQAPQVAIDSSGNALATWSQSDGVRTNIWANRYVAGTGWGTAQLIETNNAGDASAVQIAIDRSGNATAVWSQSDGVRNNIWANRYTAATGWGTAQLLESDDAGGCQMPQVAVDGGGNAIAVWLQFDGTRDTVRSNRYVAGTGWGTVQQIESNQGFSNNPQIALDANGNALAVWSQSDGTQNNVWSARYTAAGWSAPGLIENMSRDADEVKIQVDGSGNAIAVWSQSDGARVNIWANRFE